MAARPFVAAALAATAVGACTAQREAPAPPPSPARYSVADFYRNNEYAGASFSADGARILVSSNRSGIWNAYAVPSFGGEPEPLTRSTTDSVFAASYFPKDDRILYTSDQGGNERSHVYVRHADGTVKDLTPGKKLNARFVGWALDDASFFVVSNERDERFFDVYEYATDSHARTLVVPEHGRPRRLGAISRDKRYVALTKNRTTNDSDVWLSTGRPAGRRT